MPNATNPFPVTLPTEKTEGKGTQKKRFQPESTRTKKVKIARAAEDAEGRAYANYLQISGLAKAYRAGGLVRFAERGARDRRVKVTARRGYCLPDRIQSRGWRYDGITQLQLSPVLTDLKSTLSGAQFMDVHLPNTCRPASCIGRWPGRRRQRRSGGLPTDIKTCPAIHHQRQAAQTGGPAQSCNGCLSGAGMERTGLIRLKCWKAAFGWMAGNIVR